MFIETEPNCFINTNNLFKVIAHYGDIPHLECWSAYGTYHSTKCHDNNEVKNLLYQMLGDQSQALSA